MAIPDDSVFEARRKAARALVDITPTQSIKRTGPSDILDRSRTALRLPDWESRPSHLGRTTISAPSWRQDWAREKVWRNNLNPLQEAGLAFAEGPVMKALETVTKPQSYLMASLKETLDWVGGGEFSGKDLKAAGSEMYFFGDLLHDFGILQGDSEWEKWGARALGFAGDIILDPLNLTGLVGKGAGIASRLASMGGRSIAQHALRNSIVRNLGEESFKTAKSLGILDSLVDDIGKAAGPGINHTMGAAVDDIVKGTSNVITRQADGSIVFTLGKQSKRTGYTVDAAGEAVKIDDLGRVIVDAATVRDIKVLMEAGAKGFQRGASGISNNQLRVAGRHIFESGLDIGDRAARSLDNAGEWVTTKGFRKPIIESIEQADNLQLAFGFKVPGTGPISKKIFKHKFQQPVGLKLLPSTTPGAGVLVRGVPQATRKVMFGLTHGQNGLFGWMKRGGRLPHLRKLMRTHWRDDPVMLHAGRRTLHAAGRGDAMGRSVKRHLEIETAKFVDLMRGQNIDGVDLASAIGGDAEAAARITQEATNEGRKFFSLIADVVNEAGGYDFIKKSDGFYRPRRLSDAARQWMEQNTPHLVKKKYREPYAPSGHEKARKWVSKEQLDEAIEAEFKEMRKKNPKATRAQAEKKIRGFRDDEFMGEPLLTPGSQMDNGSLAPDVEQQIAEIMARNEIPYALFDDNLYEMLPAYIDALSKRAGEVYTETLLRNDGHFLDRIVELTHFPDGNIAKSVQTVRTAQRHLLQITGELTDALRKADMAEGVALRQLREQIKELEAVAADADRAYVAAKKRSDALIEEKAAEEQTLAELNDLIRDYEAALQIKAQGLDPNELVAMDVELNMLRGQIAILNETVNIPWTLYQNASRASFALVEFEDRLLSIFGSHEVFDDYVKGIKEGTYGADDPFASELEDLFNYYDQTGLGAWMSMHLGESVGENAKLSKPGEVADALRNLLATDAEVALKEYEKFVGLIPEMRVTPVGPATPEDILNARSTIKTFANRVQEAMANEGLYDLNLPVHELQQRIAESNVGLISDPSRMHLSGDTTVGLTDDLAEAIWTLYPAVGNRLAPLPKTLSDFDSKLESARLAIQGKINDLGNRLDPIVQTLDQNIKFHHVGRSGVPEADIGWRDYVDAKQWAYAYRVARQDVVDPISEPPETIAHLLDEVGAENVEVLAFGGSNMGSYSTSDEMQRVQAALAEYGTTDFGALPGVDAAALKDAGVHIPKGGSNPGVLIRVNGGVVPKYFYVKFYANRIQNVVPIPINEIPTPVAGTATAVKKGYAPVQFNVADNGVMETQAVDWFSIEDAKERLMETTGLSNPDVKGMEFYREILERVESDIGDDGYLSSLVFEDSLSMDGLVSRVGAVIIDDRDPSDIRVLLRMSSDDAAGEPWSQKSWSLAGGKIDATDVDAEAALKREVSEEIGSPTHWDLVDEDVEVVGLVPIFTERGETKEFFVVRLKRGEMEGQSLVTGHKPGDGKFVVDPFTGEIMSPADSGRQRILGEMLANAIYRIVGKDLQNAVSRPVGETVSTGASLNRAGDGFLPAFEGEWALTTEYGTNLSSMNISGGSTSNVHRIALKQSDGQVGYLAAEPVDASAKVVSPGSPEHAGWITADGKFIQNNAVAEVTESSELIGESMMLDILLSNWDAMGLHGDNMAIDKVTGQLVRLDNGGGFHWSATGEAFKYQRRANLDEVEELFPTVREGEAKWESGAFFDPAGPQSPARSAGMYNATPYQRAKDLWNADGSLTSDTAELSRQLQTILNVARVRGGWSEFVRKVLPNGTSASDVSLFARFLDKRARKLAERFQIEYTVNSQRSRFVEDVWEETGRDANELLGNIESTYDASMAWAKANGRPAWTSKSADDVISTGADPRSQAIEWQELKGESYLADELGKPATVAGDGVPNNNLLFSHTWVKGAKEQLDVIEQSVVAPNVAKDYIDAMERTGDPDDLFDSPLGDVSQEIEVGSTLDVGDPSQVDLLEKIADKMLNDQMTFEQAEAAIKAGSGPEAGPELRASEAPPKSEQQMIAEVSGNWAVPHRADAPFTPQQRNSGKIGVVVRENGGVIRRMALNADEWSDIVVDVADYGTDSLLMRVAVDAVHDATGLSTRVVRFLPDMDENIPYFMMDIIAGTPTRQSEILPGQVADLMRVVHTYRGGGKPTTIGARILGAGGDWLDSLYGTNVSLWSSFASGHGTSSSGGATMYAAYGQALLPQKAKSIRVWGMPGSMAEEYAQLLYNVGAKDSADLLDNAAAVVKRFEDFKNYALDPQEKLMVRASGEDRWYSSVTSWFDDLMVGGRVQATSKGMSSIRMSSIDSTADFLSSVLADDGLRFQLIHGLHEVFSAKASPGSAAFYGGASKELADRRAQAKAFLNLLHESKLGDVDSKVISATKKQSLNVAQLNLALMDVLDHPRLQSLVSGEGHLRHDVRKRIAFLGFMLQSSHFDQQKVRKVIEEISTGYVGGISVSDLPYDPLLKVHSIAFDAGELDALLQPKHFPRGIKMTDRTGRTGDGYAFPEAATSADGEFYVSLLELFDRARSTSGPGMGHLVISNHVREKITAELTRWLTSVDEASWARIVAHFDFHTDPASQGSMLAFVNEMKALQSTGLVAKGMYNVSDDRTPAWFGWIHKYQQNAGGASYGAELIRNPAIENVPLTADSFAAHALLRWRRDMSSEGFSVGVWANAGEPGVSPVGFSDKAGVRAGGPYHTKPQPNMVVINPRAMVSSDLEAMQAASILDETELLEATGISKLGGPVDPSTPKDVYHPDRKLGYFFPTQAFIDAYETRLIGVGQLNMAQGADGIEAAVVAVQADVALRTKELAVYADEIELALQETGAAELAQTEARDFLNEKLRLEVASKAKVANYRDAIKTIERMTGRQYQDIDLDILSDDYRNLLFAVNHLADADVQHLRFAREALEQGDGAAEALKWLEPVGEDTTFFPLAKWQDREEILETVWAAGFQKFGTYTQGPADMVEAMTAVTRFRAKGGWGAFLNQYDKIYNLLKGYMIMKPGFHMRNYFSGVFMNYLADVDMASYRQFQRAYWTYRHQQAVANGWTERAAKMKKSMKKRQIWGKTKSEHIDYIRDMDQAGFLGGSHGQVAGEFDLDLPVIAGKRIDFKTAVNPMNPRNALLRISRETGVGTETFLRGVMGFDALKKGNTVDGAYDNIVKFHFDYDDLSDFERRVVKRIVPFYTWTKRAIPLMLEQIGQNPAKMTAYLKAKRNIERDLEEPGIIPDYFRRQGGIQLPFKYKGESMFVLPDLPFKAPIELLDPALAFKKDMPFEDRMRSVLGSLGTQLSPLIKAPYEWQAKTNLWKGYSFQGRWQQVPTVYHKTPGLMHAMQVAGLSAKENDIWIMRDYNLHTMTQLLPTLADMRRLFPSEERYQQRTLSTWMSFAFGLGLRTNTVDEQLRQQRANWYRLQEKRSDERSRQRAGVSIP